MFMVLSLWHSHCESSPVHLINVEQCQMAVNTETKPTKQLEPESTCGLLESTPTTAIYYYYSA